MDKETTNQMISYHGADEKIKQQMNAELWIQYLEITKKSQRIGALGDDKTGFCCMGIGCVLLKIPYQEFEMFSNLFKSRVGLINGHRISQLNDDKRYNFKQIAAELKANPEKYFTWAETTEQNHGM